MKNLKRVLSMGLASVMLIGMMAVGASAVNASDFTDADEIQHAEAVSIATALKIIDGKEDGSFDPNGTVTRGQMAKMITRAMFGGEDPILGTKATPSFTDIKGRWDEKYIEYCFTQGIINGRGDGTFDPEGNVTGTEAAKMLLVALGYDVNVYSLTGVDWAINTNSLANGIDAKLYDGLRGINPEAALTRDQTAQMVYNTLNAKTKNVIPVSSTTGTITWEYHNGDPFLYVRYGAIRVEGVVDANEYTNNAETMKGKTSLKSISNNDEVTALVGGAPTNLTFNVASGKDVFGRAVILYVKPATSTPKNMSRAEVISEVILDVDTNVEFTTTGDTSKGISKYATDNGLKFGDRNDDVAGVQAAEFYVNYATPAFTTDSDADSENDTYASGEFGYVSAGVPNYKNVQGAELTIIDNDADGVVDVVLLNLSTFGQVTKYTTKGDNNITVKTAAFKSTFPVTANSLVPSNEELKNVVAYEDIKADDYVNCTKVDSTYYITKAETINGDLDSFENDAETGLAKSATVDGEKYKTTKVLNAYTADGLKTMENVATRNVLTNEVTLYLDAYGYAVAGETKAVSDWLFVANAAVNNSGTSLRGGTMTAYVYLQDGTSGSYVIDKYTPAGTTTAVETFVSGTDDEAIMGKLFQYSVTKNGHLVLEGAEEAGTDTLAKQSEMTIADGTKGVIYDRELSKLTEDADGDGTAANSDQVKYVTMDTVVFFVTLKADGTISKVNIYNEKTTPSVKYQSENGSGALYNSGSTFHLGATYVATAGSKYDLDAVVFTTKTTVGSDWLYVIDYVRSVDGGRVYNAIVDGEVVEINTTDTTGYSRKANTAYSYSLDGDQYALDAASYDNTLVQVGKVSLIDRKSIIVEDGGTGREAKITNSTITAHIDGADTELDVNVAVGDVVYLIVDESRNAKAILILAEYDDTAADVVYTTPDKGITKSGTTYTVDLSDSEISDRASLEAAFVVSGGATVKLGKTAKVPGTDAVSTIPDDVADADVTAGTVYLYIISEGAAATDTDGYTVYTVTIQA